ncbi:hypothetical protein [uncultured Jannaschia sp.]|uniref:hypothetical protein n=1 Tax=uncultured Jannaschia sp. TaxID=293347 RepID=UPI0026122212|nr:hypothetical protein [uncultured Jannaschia sp.]
MFAPFGYTSLHTLWKEFVARHAEPLCEVARTKYAASESIGDFIPISGFGQFGSPADFVEQAFIETFDGQAISFVTTREAIGRFAASDDSGPFRLLDRLTAFEATTYILEHDPEVMQSSVLRSVGSDEFDPWPHTSEGLNVWREYYVAGQQANAPFRQLRFHTLPYTFERNRFIVPREPPPWGDDLIDELFAPRLREHGGQSFALTDDEARDWRRRVLSPRYIEAQRGGSDGTSTPGRPSRREEIRLAYRNVFPTGDQLSWKRAQKAVQDAGAPTVSLDTFKRAVRDLRNKRQH